MDKKFCRLCQTTKNITEFAWKIEARNLRQSYCKSCQKIRSKAHYYKNRQSYIDKARKRSKMVLKQIQNYVWTYLSIHKCVDCGESDTVVLEFDHQRDKQYNVSELIRQRSNLAKVKLEVEKCVVRCANCHRRKTAIDFGWKKNLLPR